jgi:hypothetical protein
MSKSHRLSAANGGRQMREEEIWVFRVVRLVDFSVTNAKGEQL